MAIQSLSQSWPTEIREPVFKSSKTYACCADWEREVAIGREACKTVEIMPPFATVTCGPCAARIFVQ